MPVLPDIQAQANALTTIFRDLHQHPELGFEENRTSRIVAEQLRTFGVDEVATGIGGPTRLEPHEFAPNLGQ